MAEAFPIDVKTLCSFYDPGNDAHALANIVKAGGESCGAIGSAQQLATPRPPRALLRHAPVARRRRSLTCASFFSLSLQVARV
jgi:hypothetical protein